VAEAKLANVFDIESKIATELRTLDSVVEQRLRLAAQRETTLANLAALHAKFQEILEPLVDDAGFDVVITSEELATQSKEAVAGLVESGVDALLALLTLRADGNLAAGLLAQAASVDDPALIQPFRERFSSAAAAMDRSLARLHESPESERLRKGERGAGRARRQRGQHIRGPCPRAPGRRRDTTPPGGQTRENGGGRGVGAPSTA
jgi:hypothetical protein